MELLKLLSASEIVAQIVGFLILLSLLRVFAWKKILGILDERKAKISSGLSNIENTKVEIEKLKAEYASKLSVIEDTAKIRIHEAVTQGRKITEEVKKKAHEEAQNIINSAKENIKGELDKAKQELKEEIIDLTIKATENLIRERITGDDDKKLVRDFLDNIDNLSTPGDEIREKVS